MVDYRRLDHVWTIHSHLVDDSVDVHRVPFTQLVH